MYECIVVSCSLIVVGCCAAASGNNDDVKTFAHTNNFCLQAKVSLVSGEELKSRYIQCTQTPLNMPMDGKKGVDQSCSAATIWNSR